MCIGSVALGENPELGNYGRSMQKGLPLVRYMHLHYNSSYYTSVLSPALSAPCMHDAFSTEFSFDVGKGRVLMWP